MILGRLLERTIDRGVGDCMTSDAHPDELYRGGWKPDKFAPAIALIRQRLEVLRGDGGVDYRLRALERLSAYYTPLTSGSEHALERSFRELAGAEEKRGALAVEGRPIPCRRRAGGVVWFDFGVLCGWGARRATTRRWRGASIRCSLRACRGSISSGPRRCGVSRCWWMCSTTMR